MVDLPKKKVGIVACSGEELPEGTVTRLAALKVWEQLRPADTVTICLPLFLAGGEGDRAFARFYPTIAVDGCDLRCAARGTEMYSGKPAASLVVSELVQQNGLEQPEGLRRLNAAGMQTVDLLAEQIAIKVDELLGRSWNRRTGEFILSVIQDEASHQAPEETVQAICSCGSGIPIQKMVVAGRSVTVVALPLIGIISVRDLIRAFINVLGIHEPGTLLCILAENKLGTMKRIFDAISEERIPFGSILVARHWEEGKRAGFPYLLTSNVARVKKKLESLGFELLEPMEWYLDELPKEDQPKAGG